MNISAAAYGRGRPNLIFLADSASDEDISGFLVHLSKVDAVVDERKGDEVFKEIGLKDSKGYAGQLYVASRDGFQRFTSHIRITLTPYVERLRNPKFITGEVMGEKQIKRILGAYDFVVIEAIDRESLEDYNARFADLPNKPPIRVQPQQDQSRSVAIGRSWLDF